MHTKSSGKYQSGRERQHRFMLEGTNISKQRKNACITTKFMLFCEHAYVLYVEKIVSDKLPKRFVRLQ